MLTGIGRTLPHSAFEIKSPVHCIRTTMHRIQCICTAMAARRNLVISTGLIISPKHFCHPMLCNINVISTLNSLLCACNMATCKIKLSDSDFEDDSVSSCYLDVNLYTETKTIKAGAI